MPRTVTWCNKELSHLKASTKWLFNQAKMTSHWESYKMVLICYNLGETTVGGSSMYLTGPGS
jgi:hypothetical protein